MSSLGNSQGEKEGTPNLFSPTFAVSSVLQFVHYWKASTLNERQGAQQHFGGLCELLNQPKPIDADPHAESYAYEKGVTKLGGKNGFADVWRRDCFAWEYKAKGKSLSDAYKQLLQYREDLDNPPLLIVCDFVRFEVHTNFTGTVKQVYAFDLDDLAKNIKTDTCLIPPLDVLRLSFEKPERLRPDRTTAQITAEAAANLGKIAASLRGQGIEPLRTAKFLTRLIFCLFAEDIGLLPEKCFTRLVTNTRNNPAAFRQLVGQLFQAMATGGWFGADEIRHFNGGLFEDAESLEISGPDLVILEMAAKLNWDHMEPAILGTLFERGLDPAKRSQLGAHYTSREDIEAIVEPVLMAPLRRRWKQVQSEVQELVDRRSALMQTGPQSSAVPMVKATKEANRLDALAYQKLEAFRKEISEIRVLDPACGSGNFLYVALKSLLDLEKGVRMFGIARNLPASLYYLVHPEQMRGIEINEYAHQLTSVTVWIGFIQWIRDNGESWQDVPVLRGLPGLVNKNALVTATEEGTVSLSEWPEADIIIGNPPFLGDKKMRAELGHENATMLRQQYEGSVSGGSDLVCYWFERARRLITEKKVKRAGLLATNSIRFGENRRVLDRIKDSGDIFMAWSDRAWVLDGAAVRVSMVGFDDGSDTERTLNGKLVPTINADLSARPDVTTAQPLPENDGITFLGMMKAGPFDLEDVVARRMLSEPVNVNGRPNTEVIRRRLGGQDIVGRPRGGWVIDFADIPEEEAALYELPFEYVRRHVKPVRDANRDRQLQANWWRHGRSRPALRKALTGKARCIVTPEVAKHRIFVWMSTDTVPDHKLHVIARDDDYFFGVLQSRIHEVWSLAIGNYMGVGNDPCYNSSRTFGTFAMPWPPGEEPIESAVVLAIAAAARRLVELRDNWLNPPGASEADLKKRTLTNLYNARPSWLDSAHRKLDEAVFAAYGWPADLTENEILERLLTLNLGRHTQSKSSRVAIASKHLNTNGN